MSDRMRWRYGDTNPVVAAVQSATVIEIGDLVWLDEHLARPASNLPHQANEAADQALLADKFLGVAMQRSRAGDTTPIRVATTGVFEFECPSMSLELGDLMGADGNATADGLLDQQVDKVAAAANAIGRVAKREGNLATSACIAIVSTVMCGGVEGSSAS